MGASRSRDRVYRWEEGARLPAKLAQVAGQTIERVRTRGGRFKAAALVAAARPKTHPLHRLFEWNDKIAGRRFREEQARDIIRKLVVIMAPNGTEHTMPVAVSFGPGDDYVTTPQVMTSGVLRAKLLAQALREAESWARRYHHLEELCGVFEKLKEVSAGLAGQLHHTATQV